MITYENFITLGLVAAVPASAGDHDLHLDDHVDNHRDGDEEDDSGDDDVSFEGYDSIVYQSDFRANPMKLAGALTTVTCFTCRNITICHK